MSDDDDQNQQQPAGQPPELVLGDPFAMAGGCEFLPRDDAKNVHGCRVCIVCDCGRKLIIDLLRPEVKQCPGCKQQFTHVLLVSTVDDVGITSDLFEQIMQANGIQPPNEEPTDASPPEEATGGDDTAGDDAAG